MKSNVFDNAHILLMRARLKTPFKLTVSGTSMLPVLRDGDHITVYPRNVYDVGDVLVFIYGQNEILAHRLLKMEGGRCFCKGDNSFRIENIEMDKVVGAVDIADDPHKTTEFLKDSYAISQIHKEHGYQIEVTKQDPQYREYCRKYLRELE